MKKLAAVLTSWGPTGLFMLALLDSAGVPLPAAVDALLVATAIVSPGTAYWSALLATVGSVVGSFFLYGVARKGGQVYLERYTESEKAHHFREWFQTYGLITVFIPCLLPIPMPLKVFVLSAGALGTKPLNFVGTILGARVPRYFGLAWLGAEYGEKTMPWLKGHVWQLVAVALVLGLGMGFGVRQLGKQGR